MANDEHRESEEMVALKRQLQELEAALETAQNSGDRRQMEVDALSATLGEAEQQKAAAHGAATTASLVADAATKRADAAERAAEAANKRAEAANQRAEESLKKLGDQDFARDLLAKEEAARRGLRDFVRESLSDIMSGVDDAAAIASCRRLNDGLEESGLVSPSRVGSVAGRGAETLVEFDVAVVAGEQRMDGRQDSKETGGTVGLSFMKVIPLGFSAKVSRTAARKTTSEDRSEISTHNRIRFTVPIRFASSGELLD